MTIRYRISVTAALLLLSFGPPVSAFELGGLVKDIASGQSPEAVLRSSIQTITESQLGQLPDGVALPGRDDVITMYATEWCGYCRQARADFKKERIFVVEKDIEKRSAAKVYRNAEKNSTALVALKKSDDLVF